MARVKKPRIILKAVGAGIQIILWGIEQSSGKWKFMLEKDEGTMADFLSEEDADLLEGLHSQSEYVHGWDQALKLLDRYPWIHFVPEEIDSAFGRLIWSALLERKPKSRFTFPISHSWGKMCRIGNTEDTNRGQGVLMLRERSARAKVKQENGNHTHTSKRERGDNS